VRLCIRYRADTLPILYRHRFIALIKEALSISDLDYKNSIYPDEGSEKSKKAKPFCFAVSISGKREAKKERFSLSENIEINETVFHLDKNSRVLFYISSPDYYFIMNLYNGLLKIDSFNIEGKSIIKLDKILMAKENRIKRQEVIFNTLSPILIENKSGKPLLPTKDELEIFNREMNAIQTRIIKDLRGDGLKDDLKFEPIQIKKQIVKHTLRGFREKTNKPFMTLTCTEGVFKLKGHPEDLNFIYQTGLGLRTGQGFGMLEVI